MMRVLLLLLLFAPLSCGDDAEVGDMTVAVDFVQPNCGESSIKASCAGVGGAVGCYVCVLTPGGGQCGLPCRLSAKDCPSSETCEPFADDGGINASYAADGDGCAGYGYCK